MYIVTRRPVFASAASKFVARIIGKEKRSRVFFLICFCCLLSNGGVYKTEGGEHRSRSYLGILGCLSLSPVSGYPGKVGRRARLRA
jgi:hypothetical protein